MDGAIKDEESDCGRLELIRVGLRKISVFSCSELLTAFFSFNELLVAFCSF